MSQFSNKVIPETHFPDLLDSNYNLFQVFNTSESELISNFNLEDDIIYIKPRKWNELERWYFYGGLINIEGEIIYYNEVEYEEDPNPPIVSNIRFFNDPNISEEEKNKYRRITAFKTLVRNKDYSRIHLSGEWVRGYVMAEHHNALKQSLLGAETLIGIDNSTDHLSIDYRLRDLEELNAEKDDLDCPYGIYWYEVIATNSDKTLTIQFHISIIGDYESFSFLPKEGAEPITDDLNPIYTYNEGETIGASLVVRRGDCCSCVSENSVPCEPCEFQPIIPEIPILQCPDIIIPPIVIPPVDCTWTCPDCTPCTTTDVSSPNTEIIFNFTYSIYISTSINISAPTAFATATAYINWQPPGGEGPGDGACFRLVPCGGTTS